MSTTTRLRRPDDTPDSHLFPTRPYDLVKEFVVALAAITALTVLLAVAFGSPDRKAITLRAWADAAPTDVVATATAELAGTSASAAYGGPYDNLSDGQKIGPLALEKWAGAYGDALAAAPGNEPARVKGGTYGPVPVLATRFLALARSGGLESLLVGSDAFYSTDQTKPMLLLSDGAYLEDQARAEHLGGDQWGMMNESGNYPGQPWMWLYTFWYQVKPFSTSGNADALVWGLMMVLTVGLLLLPFIPGLRALPRHLGVHKLIWRDVPGSGTVTRQPAPPAVRRAR